MDGSLFLISRADIFSIYPKIFKELLVADDVERQKAAGRLPKDVFNVPSDYEWKLKVYFRLLEVQRKLNEKEEQGEPPMKLYTLRDVELWDEVYDFENISPTASPTLPILRKHCHIDDPIKFINLDELGIWSLEIIAKSGMLLRKPKISCQFQNEHEMRRVYSLIYDVFRYKIILGQALSDAGFFKKYEKLSSDVTRVWLILFDLHMRRFEQRDPEETTRKNHLYGQADLLTIDECLWQHRIRLAAAFSRLRIKSGALSLSQLLPPHLQDEKVALAVANPLVSGFLNPFVFPTRDLAIAYLVQSQNMKHSTGTSLEYHHFKFDNVCPLFLQCLPENRGEFAQTELVVELKLVLQDRAFSIGPAICSRLLDYFEINGDIVQTHVSSPRSTAYLACLFYTNSRIKDFLAFGAGNRVKEYRAYMKKLGINNIKIFSENYTDLTLKSNLLERAVGVFATPPNSYSGVTDPIDLICSRGGDLTMLEVLTESEISDSGKQRVAQVLQEQRETLRLSLSRPQIQFVLYETHSMVSSENEEMLEKAVEDVNRAVYLKHYFILKERLRQEALAAQEGGFMPCQSPSTPNSSRRKVRKQSTDQLHACNYSSGSSDEEYESDSHDDMLDGQDTAKSRISSRKSNTTTSCEDEVGPVIVPLTDVFEIMDLPDICINQDQCLNLKDHGCFLALTKRKEITKFDSKYLIKMAETRGLFGDSKPKTARSKTSVKKQEKKEVEERDKKKTKRKKSDITVLINRLSTPTLSYLNHIHFQNKSAALKKILIYDPIRCRCLRHMFHHDEVDPSGDEVSEGRVSSYLYLSQAEQRAVVWWRETVEFLKKLAKLKAKRNFKTLFQPVREQKIMKLRLPRVIKLDQDDTNSTTFSKYAKSQPADRVPYPMSVSYLEYERGCMSLTDFYELELDDNFMTDEVPLIPYMTQYIKQTVEEPMFYSLT